MRWWTRCASSRTGRITKAMSLPDKLFANLIKEVAYLKKMISEKYGVDIYFHPHCASFIETPWEIERLLEGVPDLKLIVDT